MSKSSKVLLCGPVAVGLLLSGLVLVLGTPFEPTIPSPTSVGGGCEAPLRSGLLDEPTLGLHRDVEVRAGADARGGCGSSLEVRISSPQAGELELVLRRGSLEWGRGVTTGGRLRFDGLGQGSYLLRAEDTAGLLAELAPQEEWRGTESTWRRVEVPGHGATIEVELCFVRPATLAGIVRDPGGAPVPAAKVLVQDVQRPALVQRISTDELGGFHVSGLVPSRYGVALAADEELVALPLEQTLGAGQAAWIELRLEEGRRTIRGRVLDRRRHAVAGLRMVCAAPSARAGSKGRPPASRIVARVRTDAEGVFHFEELPAAALRVALDAREVELMADGRHRRLRRGFVPLDVDTVGGDVDLGVLAVERPPGEPRSSR